MKRAIFVSVGTVVGLTATLRYTPVAPSLDTTTLALGELDGIDSSPSATPDTGTPTPVPSVSPSATKSAAASSSPSASNSAMPTASVTKKPVISSTPIPKVTTKPTPKPTPQITYADVTGSIETAGEYGTTQAIIRVSNKKIISVSYLLIPDIHEESKAISFNAIRQLKPKILAAQSASVSYVSGATYTSDAFLKSVANAIAKAGL